jgi:hypothetical protein
VHVHVRVRVRVRVCVVETSVETALLVCNKTCFGMNRASHTLTTH